MDQHAEILIFLWYICGNLISIFSFQTWFVAWQILFLSSMTKYLQTFVEVSTALCILCPTKLYLHKPQQGERKKKSTKKLFACFTHYWYIAVQKKLVFYYYWCIACGSFQPQLRSPINLAKFEHWSKAGRKAKQCIL